MKDVVIIGGGAAGIVAAIFAALNNSKVTLLERNDKCGKKLLITGNGRCNYWNSDQNLNHYHTDDIDILKESDMLDIPNGNFILAGHAGTGYYAYFKNLKKLEKGDIAYIYYNASKYKYVLVDKYEIDKTGKALIVKNENDTAMTLITCKDNEDKQLIFIFSKEG